MPSMPMLPLADLGALPVVGVEVRRVDLPFVRPVRTARGVVTGRRPVLVRVLGADGEEGWGECSAEDAPGYWHEYADACEVVLRALTVEGDVTVGTIPLVPGWPMASAALECAVLDALTRRAGVSLASWLGGRRTHVDATVTLGIDDDAGAGVPYRHVKLKLDGGTAGSGSGSTGVRLADDSVGETHTGSVAARVAGLVAAGVTVSADANGSLTADGFAALAGLRLDHVEQPLPADDLVGHASLRRIVPDVPVALDESVRSAGDIRTIAALGAADIVVLKPGRLGGLLAARRAHDAAVAAGLRCKVGGMWDTGIGRAAALAVASLPGCSVAPDLAAADRYWSHDVVADPVTVDDEGRLTVPAAPGLGIEVDVDVDVAPGS